MAISKVGQVLSALALFFCSGSLWAGQLWSNANGSLVRTSDGNASWVDYDWWNNALADASADGAGGVISRVSQSMSIAGGEASIAGAMTESASTAELAAAAAFLPEAAIYAIAGATLGQLIWDAATQTYEIPYDSTVGPAGQSMTCSDGSLARFSYGNTYYSTAEDAFHAAYPNATITGSSVSGDSVTINYTMPGFGNLTDVLGSSCPGGSNLVPSPPSSTPVPPSGLPPYILPWLQSNPNSAPPLAGKEGAAGHPPQSSGPVLSGPSSVSLPPVTTTTVNPDGSQSSSTISKTITLTYSGPNASGSTSTKTTTSTTPAPTASDPNPAPIPGPTTSSSSPAPAPASSAPQNPFVPPDVAISSPTPIPPAVINLPLPTIDNSTGTCPAPIVINLGLPGMQTVTWDLTPWCTLAQNLRPLVLTAAGLAAAFLLVR